MLLVSKKYKKIVIKIIIILIFIIIMLILINAYLIININVPTESMENTIHVDNKLIGSRISYIISDINRYDIVVAEDPFINNRMIVKRVVGLPGENVIIKEGDIYINGSKNPLKESYLKEKWVKNNNGYVFDIPQNHYLLLGDNRNNSADARLWFEQMKSKNMCDLEKIYISKEKIIAKIIFCYAPQIKLF